MKLVNASTCASRAGGTNSRTFLCIKSGHSRTKWWKWHLMGWCSAWHNNGRLMLWSMCWRVSSNRYWRWWRMGRCSEWNTKDGLVWWRMCQGLSRRKRLIDALRLDTTLSKMARYYKRPPWPFEKGLKPSLFKLSSKFRGSMLNDGCFSFRTLYDMESRGWLIFLSSRVTAWCHFIFSAVSSRIYNCQCLLTGSSIEFEPFLSLHSSTKHLEHF